MPKAKNVGLFILGKRKKGRVRKGKGSGRF